MTALAEDPPTLPDFDKLWNFRQPAETEARFRDLLTTARSSGDRIYLGLLLTQLARAQGLQGKLEEGHHALAEVETILEEVDSSLLRVRYLLERGRLFDSPAHRPDDKAPERARPLFIDAWELGRGAGLDTYAVDAAHMLGIIEPPLKALEWNRKAIALAERSNSQKARRWLGPLLNNTGWTYHDMGEYEQALELFEKDHAYRQAEGQGRQACIARWSMGRALRSLGRIEEALALQTGLLEEWAAIGEEPSGYTYEELGECLLLSGRPKEAAEHFARAHARLSQDEWFKANHAGRLARLAELADPQRTP